MSLQDVIGELQDKIADALKEIDEALGPDGDVTADEALTTLRKVRAVLTGGGL